MKYVDLVGAFVLLIVCTALFFVTVDRRLDPQYLRCAPALEDERLKESTVYSDRIECVYEYKRKGRPYVLRKEVVWKN